jgi:hypothetical protein
MESHSGMILRRENQTCPSATFSTTNPTWTDRSSNLGLHGERSANNCLSHGTAVHVPAVTTMLIIIIIIIVELASDREFQISLAQPPHFYFKIISCPLTLISAIRCLT